MARGVPSHGGGWCGPTSKTWRRAAYLLVSAPLALVWLVTAAVGRSATATRWQGRAAAGLLGVRTRGGAGRAAGVLLLSWVTLPVTAYALAILPVNLLYPLRPDTDDLSNAWGGPSLAGAWAVHAGGALVLLWVIAPLIAGCAWLHARVLGGDRDDRG